MHLRRLAALITGAWLLGSLLMMMVAIQNFRAVDRLLANPSLGAVEHIQKFGQQASRALLRYHSSELNRFYFTNWERIQLVLGVSLIALIWVTRPRRRLMLGLAAAMLAIVFDMRWAITPEIVRLGRLRDFLLPHQATAETAQFWRYHYLYTVLEVIKILAGGFLAVLLVRGKNREQPGRPDNPQRSARARHGAA